MAVSSESFQASIASVEPNERGLQIRIQLRNQADRALHYISAVRGLAYDPATKHLTIRLTDEGRAIVPGAANVRPPMRFIDPAAEAEITVQVPAQISKLAPSPDGDNRRVAFERHRIADAADVTIEIGWADVPFYEDPRPRDTTVMPSVHWQQHRETATLHRRTTSD